MSVKFKIDDGKGSGDTCEVVENSLLVSTLPYPPLTQQKVVPFRQYLTVNGLSTGSNDMRVVGTLSAPVLFYIKADADNDRYITTLSFLIADAGATVSQFGSIAALANGCQAYYGTIAGEVILHEALKSNFDFLRLSLFKPSFGSGADSFRAQNVVGLSEAYVPVVDLITLIPPFGIKLDAGSSQKLVVAIRDTTTAVDAFNCVAYGFDRKP